MVTVTERAKETPVPLVDLTAQTALDGVQRTACDTRGRQTALVLVGLDAEDIDEDDDTVR